jgi:tRNA threonylcarbamoyl adenosine modification protein YjeE
LPRDLPAGLDVPDSFTVTSPTYTLVNEYPGRLPFYHVDLYRLPEPVDPDEIGLMDIFEENAIVAVEWARRLDPCRPSPQQTGPVLQRHRRYHPIDSYNCIWT